MKLKPTIATINILAAVLILASACNDNNAVDNDTPVAARITAGMAGDAVATPAAKAGQPVTRAANDHWNSDHIGVLVTASPGSDMATGYRNAHYTTTSTAVTADFSPATPAHTIYFSGPDATVTFAAYAPYQTSANPGALPGTDGIVPVNTTTQTDATEQEAIDFLYAAGATASKASPTVRFTRVDATNDHAFRHAMSRLVLNIETPAEYGFDATDVSNITNISLELLAQSGTFDVKTGIATATAEPAPLWDITGNLNETPAPGTLRTYTLILLPQQVKNAAGTPAAVPISITFGGQVYKNDKDITGSTVAGKSGFFQPGTSYEYTIRLRNKDLEVTGATITDWADGGSSTGDATPQQPQP